MKVLLTGTNGFVGSHILDSLCERRIPVAALLRRTSDKTFLEHRLPGLDIRSGSITAPASLTNALQDITHIIHCAGCTKAVRVSEFYAVNQGGTRNIITAANAAGAQIQRLIHISSLAAAGPAPASQPAREQDPPRPVSEYGKSKLAAENEVRQNCRAPFVILRPPAVYGPRDTGFLSLFQAVRNHLLPLTSEQQTLSLVYVKDLANAAVHCLEPLKAERQTYFVAAREIVTGRQMAKEIARQMGRWTIPLPLPAPAFWPVCLAQELISRLTNKPNVLNLAKYPELKAHGWVCDPERMERDLSFRCSTPLRQGITAALEWYRAQNWL